MSPARSRRPSAAVVVVALVAASAMLTALIAAVVASPGPAGATKPPDLPPSERTQLARRFDPALAPLGLRVSRGVLQNLRTYTADPTGTHLALYVEPSRAYTNADYVTNFTKVTGLFVPMVFDRWKGLKSFDVCQEPPPGVDDRPEPPPVTQIFVRRKALTRVENWKTASLEELLGAVSTAETASSDYSVYFNSDVQTDPAFQRAAAAAGWKPS
jgi:hypothetical protein